MADYNLRLLTSLTDTDYIKVNDTNGIQFGLFKSNTFTNITQPITITGSSAIDVIKVYDNINNYQQIALSIDPTAGGILDLKENNLSVVKLRGTSIGNYGASYFLNRVGFGISSGLGVGNVSMVTIKGSGTTSATNSLLIQNSVGTNIFNCRDDGVVQLITLLPDKILFNGGTMTISVNGTGNITTFYNSGTIGQKIQTQTSTNLLLSPGTVAGNTVVIESIGGTSANVNNSAILQTNSTTQGFLPPVMTTAQKNAIVTPAAGLVVFDSTLGKLCVFSTTWQTIASA